MLPTQAGCAVFLGDGSKVIVFYIDPSIGQSINNSLSGQVPPRPLTHDLFLQAMEAMGATVTRMIIVKMENEIYHARLFFEAENEIMERKILELDARPSDSIAMAVRCGAPIYVLRELWNELEDMSSTLDEMRKRGADFGGTDVG